jgi:hypothetical protein
VRGFAYPNVHLSQFIGCGRYRCSAQGPEKEEEPARPDAGKLNEVLAAAVLLAPELTTSSLHIYERKDDKDKAYRGASLDLAYFLASIHRARRVRHPCQELEGDIWCTGAVELGQNRSPLLMEVMQSVFKTKWQAFLTTSNPDRLFLVPAANLLGEPLARDSVRVLTVSALGDLLHSTPQDAFRQKTVVEIHAHELPLLVESLFHSPPDPEIAQWFQALTDLRVQDQITDERYWEVLEHGVGSPVSRSIPHDELMDALATHRERLYFKSTTTAEQLSKIPLREARRTRVHQVLVALRFALPVIRTVLGLRFVLIPPGTVDGIDNPTPYYLAETPVNEADWARLLEDNPDVAPHVECAAVNISLPDIRRFIARANAPAGEATRFVIPTSRQWRFAGLAGGVPAFPPRGALARPSLRTTLPSALGLSDILGVVAQLCHQRDEQYEWHGGSYRTPATDFSPVPSPEPVRAGAFARNLERGFRPALEVVETARMP